MKCEMAMWFHRSNVDTAREAKQLFNALGAIGSTTKITSLRTDSKYPYTAIVFPEQERRSIRLSSTQAAGLETFVSDGGVAIFSSDKKNYAGQIINSVFGKKYGSPATVTKENSTKTKQGEEVFEHAVSKLPGADATWAINGDTVDEEEQMYLTADGYVTVAHFAHGKGDVFFLAYDWFSNGGNSDWEEILEAAVQTNCGTPAPSTDEPTTVPPTAPPTPVPTLPPTEPPTEPPTPVPTRTPTEPPTTLPPTSNMPTFSPSPTPTEVPTPVPTDRKSVV